MRETAASGISEWVSLGVGDMPEGTGTPWESFMSK